MPVSDEQMFARALATIQTMVPEFRAINKVTSKLHRLIAYVLFFNKTYMTHFWTTIGYTTAYPQSDMWAWQTLYHEGFHAIQCKRSSRLWMSMKYLMPQLVGIIGLFATIPLMFWTPAPWWLGLIWLGVSLLCLAPLPAYWRMQLELEAYTVSLSIHYWYRNIDRCEHYAEYFTGSSYYFMWPFKASILTRLQGQMSRIRSNLVLDDPYFRAVFLDMQVCGLVHLTHASTIREMQTRYVTVAEGL